MGKLRYRDELTSCHTDTSRETGKKTTTLHSSQLTAGHGFFPPSPWCEQNCTFGSRAAVPWGAPGHGCVAPTRSWVTGSGPAVGWAGTGMCLGLRVSCFPPAVLPAWTALWSQPQHMPSEASSKIALDISLWIIPISYYCERKSQTWKLVCVLVIRAGLGNSRSWPKLLA